MATSIVMPQMGYDMQEGTVLKWHKKEGDEVARGEIIAEIETDKATVEFEAFVGGVLRKIVAAEGVAIPVGEVIAVIGTADEELPDDIVVTSDAPPKATAPQTSADPAPALADAPERAPGAEGEVRASPLARRLAKERGIDLSTLTGSGPGGRIVEEDVLAYQKPTTEAAAPAISDSEVRASPIARRLARERGIQLAKIPGTGPGGRVVEEDVLKYQEPPEAVNGAVLKDERVELSRMRQTIAKVTSDSKRDAPHFYVTAEIDMTKAVDFRRDINDAVAAESR
ncbi:MAG: E3 binding domain-containing protein, partial [Proteobacteria bacterium]|nr:E3 binding domain-containing protein [Pseudomonadota bacterium]